MRWGSSKEPFIQGSSMVLYDHCRWQFDDHNVVFLYSKQSIDQSSEILRLAGVFSTQLLTLSPSPSSVVSDSNLWAMIDSFQHSPLSFNNNNNNKWSTLDDLKKNFVSICMQSIKTPPAQYDNELFEPFIYLTMTMCELKIQNENSQNNNDKHAFLEAILTQLSNTSYVDDLYAALLGSATTVAAGTTEGSEP